jgi:histidine triad (HIT) family protein
MENCIFCKIAKGEIPSDKIYEDENFLAFLDINPVVKGHTLLIPKKHFAWMQETEDETIAEIFKLCKKIMQAAIKGLPCDYVQISVVGKDIPHFHIHLIPRHFNDNLPQFPIKKLPAEEIRDAKEKITQAL